MPRVEIPLIGPAYTNRERGLSAQKAINMWPEINPEARNQVALHNGAGLRTFATLEGVDRGMHDFNNLMYAVSGYTLFSIDANGQNTALGSIGGQNRCVMANDSTQLIITTGDTPYRYTVAGGVEAITDPDLVKPTSVAYINNQFVFDNNNGTWGEFVTSSIEPGLSIDSLDFAVAESHPDDIVRIMSFRQLVYFFGTHSVEPWQNTGTGNPPFARLNSGVQPYGLAGTHGVVATNEYMYFLDTKRIPRRSNGLAFPSIGNPALGVEFATYTRIDDVIAFEFVQDNQQFVAFTFPEANKTWCFHEPSGSWWQMTFSGVETDAVWLPPPPTTNPPTPPAQDTDNEIVAPYWENTGTWIDLTALTNTTFATQFGVAVDGADFNAVYAVEKAALVNTTDAGNRLQIQDSNDCTKAGLYITDASGNVVDSQIYTGVPNGDSVIVPSTGVNHYVVTSSDTTNAKIKKWGTVPVSTEGSVSWESIFSGYPFGPTTPTAFYRTQIPAGGLSIRLTVPTPSTGSAGGFFGAIEVQATGRPATLAINQAVHDITTAPTTTGTVTTEATITHGVNLAGQDVDLVVGQTYFWNIAFTDGAAGELFIRYDWQDR